MTLSPCPPLGDDQWPEPIEDLRSGFAGQLNVYRTMAHNPALLRAWAPLRQHLVKDSALGPQRSEVVILRTGHRLGSHYEWAITSAVHASWDSPMSGFAQSPPCPTEKMD